MSTTRFVMTFTMVALAVYDLIAVQYGGIDASISQWFAGAARYPFLIIALGYLLGHFFGWMQPPPEWTQQDRRKLKDILRDRWPVILDWVKSHGPFILEWIKAVFGKMERNPVPKANKGNPVSYTLDYSITSQDDVTQIPLDD